MSDEWHPDLQELLRYWQGIRKPGEDVPPRSAFDPMQVPHLLPRIWMLDVQREPFRLKYRLAGSEIEAAQERRLAGLWFDEAYPHLFRGSTYLTRFRRVVAERRPDRRRGSPNMIRTASRHLVENLLLPMRGTGQDVEMILAISKLWSRTGRMIL